MENVQIKIEDQDKKRLDKVLTEHFTDMSRMQLQNIIKEGYVKLNDKPLKASYKVELGDMIDITIPNPKSTDIKAEDIPLDIVYEDEDVIVVNKPTGMIVHPSAGIYSGTLVNALLYHCKDLSGINGVTRPGIVHRIDKETSGLLMIAKNDTSHQSLSKQLEEHSVIRRYYCLVHGVINHNQGRIEAPIGRDPNNRQRMTCIEKNSKSAVTNFKVLERFNDATLVECRLETGRTHQIRVHMQYIGFPVYGDPMYGLRKDDTTYGQYLHAKVLGFKHPKTNKEMYFESDLPDYFQNKLDELRKEMNHE